MWAHGLEGIGQPIGTSRDANGQVAVTVSDDDVQATSWFSQTSLEAAQIFELIDEGIVRATSVRETPIKSHLKHDPIEGEVLIVEEWDLEEWSWCAIGVNPDAVAKTLHRNRLGGQPITPSIMKSLTAVATPCKRFGIGFSTEKLMSDTTQPVNEDDPDSVVDDSPVASDDNDDGTGNQPYGSTVVSAIHASLTAACHNIEDAMGPLENPAVKEALSELVGSLGTDGGGHRYLPVPLALSRQPIRLLMAAAASTAGRANRPKDAPSRRCTGPAMLSEAMTWPNTLRIGAPILAMPTSLSLMFSAQPRERICRSSARKAAWSVIE